MTVIVTDNHAQRLERMAIDRILPAIGEELQYGAKIIGEDAAATIRENGVPSPNHIVSAPGETPNSDSGYLADSIEPGDLVILPTEARTYTGVGADYGGYLELGTSKMEPRPYLSPAMRRNRPEILEAVGKRFAEEINS
jgi:HK97 gp10 family phage protein